MGTNHAALSTWIVLKALDQIAFSKTFAKTANIKMNKLSFWTAVSSDQLRDVRATSLCLQLDHAYRQIFNANYESGSTANKARKEMKAILIDKSNTVEGLAEAVDANYRFRSESV